MMDYSSSSRTDKIA